MTGETTVDALVLGGVAAGKHPRIRSTAIRIRQQITTGCYLPGSKLPALRQLATELNVSTMTVSRALAMLESEGYVRRIPEVGVFVGNESETASQPAQSVMFTLAVAGLGTAVDQGLTRGIERASRKRGWACRILSADYDAAVEIENVARLPECGSRGGIVIPIGILADQEKGVGSVAGLKKLRATQFPMVFVDRLPSGFKADLVQPDNEEGAYQATQYLLGHGHRDILLLAHPPLLSPIVERIQGYERALREAGLEPRQDQRVYVDTKVHATGFRENQRWRGGYEAIMPVLRACRPPLAIFAMNAYIAWGVYRACQETGLRIPEDVSVIAFDEPDLAHSLQPVMTVVVQRADEIGDMAVALLARRIAENHADPSGQKEPHRRSYSHAYVDVELQEGGSVSRIGGI